MNEIPSPEADQTPAPDATALVPAKRSDGSAQRRSRYIRIGVLTAILVAISTIGLLHQGGASFKPVGVDALCPFGGIETLWSLLSGGGLIRRIAVSSVVIFGTTLLLAVVFRRAFCGYLCPLGAIQELVGKTGGVFWPKNRPQVPRVIDRPARMLKYGILVFFTLWTWQVAALVIRPYDPWVAWMHLTSAELLTEFGIGFAILVIALAGSVVYDRFFCKYLCPMGAFLGAISRFSLFKVRRNADTCTNCGACDKVCPVNVEVATVAVVQDAECINCNECVNACPVVDTLVVSASSTGADATTFRPNQVLTLVLVIMAIMIGGTTLTGASAWTMPTLASTVQSSGGVINPDDIKGSMTFADVSVATGIPPEVFKQQFGIADADMTLKIKDVAAAYGFDVHTDVRDFVRAQIAAGAVAPAGGAGAPPSCVMESPAGD